MITLKNATVYAHGACAPELTPEMLQGDVTELAVQETSRTYYCALCCGPIAPQTPVALELASATCHPGNGGAVREMVTSARLMHQQCRDLRVARAYRAVEQSRVLDTHIHAAVAQDVETADRCHDFYRAHGGEDAPACPCGYTGMLAVSINDRELAVCPTCGAKYRLLMDDACTTCVDIQPWPDYDTCDRTHDPRTLALLRMLDAQEDAQYAAMASDTVSLLLAGAEAITPPEAGALADAGVSIAHEAAEMSVAEARERALWLQERLLVSARDRVSAVSRAERAERRLYEAMVMTKGTLARMQDDMTTARSGPSTDDGGGG